MSNSLLLSMQQNQCCHWQDEYSQSWRQGRNRTCQFSVFWPKAVVILRDYSGQFRLERQGKPEGVKILHSRLLSMSHNCLWAELGTPPSCHCVLVCLHLFSSQPSYTDTCPSNCKIFMKWDGELGVSVLFLLLPAVTSFAIIQGVFLLCFFLHEFGISLSLFIGLGCGSGVPYSFPESINEL